MSSPKQTLIWIKLLLSISKWLLYKEKFELLGSWYSIVLQLHTLISRIKPTSRYVEEIPNHTSQIFQRDGLAIRGVLARFMGVNGKYIATDKLPDHNIIFYQSDKSSTQ